MRLAVALAIAFFLMGCNEEKRLTLSEARQVAVSMRGQVQQHTPPRSIDDILDIYQNIDPADTMKRAAARKLAETEPAAGDELSSFFLSRGLAAWEVGLYGQARRDMTMALERADSKTGPKIRLELGRMEIKAGNYSKGIALMESAVDGPQGGGANQALKLSDKGDLDGAMAAADEAIRLLETIQISSSDFQQWRPLWNSDIRSVQARILELRGKPQEAEQFRRLAQQSVSVPEPASKAIVGYFRQAVATNAVATATNLRLQGRLVEAEFEARNSVRLAVEKFGSGSTEALAALAGFERVLAAEGRFLEAERTGRASLAVIEKLGFAPEAMPIAMTRNRLAEILAALGRWNDALAEFDAAKRGMIQDNQSYESFLAANLTRAIALSKSGRSAEAEEVSKEALRRNQKLVGDDHFDSAESLGVLAMVHATAGKDSLALDEFRHALPVLVSHQPSAGAGLEVAVDRSNRIKAIIESYLNLLSRVGKDDIALQKRFDPVAESFWASEIGRNHILRKSISAAATRSGVGNTELQELVRQEQDTDHQIEALVSLISGKMSGSQDRENLAALNALKEKISLLKKAKTALREEIVRRFPSYAALIDPAPPSIEHVRNQVKDDEALIVSFIGEETSWVWALSKKNTAFSQVRLGKNEVDLLVKNIRSSLEAPFTTLDDIRPFDMASAYKLYASFLAPVRHVWEEAEKLTFVNDGALSSIPFSLLPTKDVAVNSQALPLFSGYRQVPWLARSHAMSYAPSVAAFMALRTQTRKAPAEKPLIAFADPLFKEAPQASTERKALPIRGMSRLAVRRAQSSGIDQLSARSVKLADLERLEETADEVRSIALALGANPSTDLFLGRQANEAIVKTMPLSDRRVVVFATHGLVPGDLDGLMQPALALTSPQIAGIDGDGLLTMDEVLDLHLNADWVVLSACNTAAANGAGGDALSGLGRAFFYAGARSVLATHWAVETESAQQLTKQTFQAEKTSRLSRSLALKQSMTKLLDDGQITIGNKVVAYYAHPLFWAPYALFGDGG
ncbi:MAG: CHAT domain-containing protein [Alphaproteobacteria bacterium]|nr:CHAT domain-containing protein [Alphaproteobacteria bacterium]